MYSHVFVSNERAKSMSKEGAQNSSFIKKTDTRNQNVVYFCNDNLMTETIKNHEVHKIIRRMHSVRVRP